MTGSASNEEPKGTSDLRNYLFTYRSYTPIPFLAIMLIFARPTTASLIVGFGLAIAGEAIRFWGVSYAGSETRTTGTVGGTQLVTSGPFAHVRNPLYIGNIFMYVGVGVMSNALMPYLPLVALVYFAFQYRMIVSLEEEYLEHAFPEWAEYKERVGRFIPRITPFESGTRLEPDYVRALTSERSSLMAVGSIYVVLWVIYVLRGTA